MTGSPKTPRPRAARAALIAALVLAAAGLLAIAHRAEPLRVGAAARISIGFRTPELLAEHYRKHGGEFGNITMQE